ncbi:MAG: hypothetical protein ACE5GH_04870, partial [Fidelibacterota bacterium]
WIDGAQVVRNGEFYENIGKYDQFVAGWDDLYDENGKEGWWEEQKSVGDSVEVLVMTERRNRYLDMRQEHNRILQIAGYAVTSILFNHVISAMDAFLETRRRSGPLKELNASASLRFSPQTPHGVGGVSLTLSW